MHIKHNKKQIQITQTQNLGLGMPHYSNRVDDMKAIADILRKHHNRELLFTICFADEVGIQMRRLATGIETEE